MPINATITNGSNFTNVWISMLKMALYSFFGMEVDRKEQTRDSFAKINELGQYTSTIREEKFLCSIPII